MEKKHLESLLFVSKEPIALEKMAHVLNEEKSVVLRWVIELQKEFENRGFRIRQVAGGFEMVTAEDCFDTIESLVQKEYEQLSRSAMETVAIVAYNQPITRQTIAQMRGVANPDYGIQALLDKQLIEETDQGYTTTIKFLKFFGINDLKELPEIIGASEPSSFSSEEETPEAAGTEPARADMPITPLD